jgi:phosphohistidine phosphatase SixA
MQALRSATVLPRYYLRSLPNGGSALGWKATFGTVEQGARADLILLASDPSRDLRALSRPNVVIAGGRLFDRPALDAMLARAAADAKAQPAAAAAVPARTVYVMRHLQKAAGNDPPLSQAGTANAKRLADLLAGANIKALFASPTRRAQETAAPLASGLGLTVTPYDPRDPAALESAAKTVAGNILIVGHSNTVPDLVERFGGKRPADLSEQDYGVIYVVKPGTGEVRQLLIEQAPSGERG